MTDLTRGANAPVKEERCALVLEWPRLAGTLDCCAFMLGSSGAVRGDEDMIFYNQPSDANDSIHLAEAASGSALFRLDLANVPNAIERIVVCVVVEDVGRTLSDFVGLVATIGEVSSRVRFKPELHDATETSLRLIEFYRRSGRWKVRADGQGFNQGLAPLARSFGVEVAEQENSSSAGGRAGPSEAPSVAPAMSPERTNGFDRDIDFDVGPVPEPLARPGVAARPRGATVLPRGGKQSWPAPDPASADPTDLRIRWSSRQGGAEGRARPLRPNLGMFYELSDGRRGAVQTLEPGRAIEVADFITLTPNRGDLQAGNEAGAQITNGTWQSIKRIDIYVYLEGAPSWRAAELELTISGPSGPPVVIELSNAEDGCSAMLLASLTNEAGSMALESCVRPSYDQRTLDSELGWNLRWRRASVG